MKHEYAENDLDSLLLDAETPKIRKSTDFKILSLDGGGIKGLYAAKLLAQIEKKTGKPIGDYFDMICGTSTGGLIGLAITKGVPCRVIADFYEKHGKLIFPYTTGLLNLTSKARQIAWSTKYDNGPLVKAITELLNDYETMDTCNHLMCIPAFNVTKGTPKVFKNPFGHYHADTRHSILNVALATSAAPTYLPSVKIEEDQYVDGGLYANNPAMIGFTEAMDHFINKESDIIPDGIIYDSVSMLSIGLPQECIGELPDINDKRSFAEWGPKLVGTSMLGSEFIAEYQARKLVAAIDGNYYRLTPQPFSIAHAKEVSMDNTSDVAIRLLTSHGQAAGDDYTSSKWHEIEHFFTNPRTYKIKDNG